MDQPETIEFKVDEQYENEKGVFTVVSIHRDEMVIRWENGEEIRTGIALQHRIAERRQWEEQQRLAAAEAARKPSRKSAKKTVFTGLAPTDFKKSASGTTWRSRNQLGAAVAQKIVTTRLKLNSWAFGNKPEMHVQDTKHHNQGEADYQAKFFVRVDQQALHYGFRVARPESKDAAPSDWSRFYEWLAQPENEQTLRTIAIENNLAVSNLASPSSATLIASEDGWRIDASTPQSDQATLNGYINDTPEPKPLDLALAASMAKDDVVACGPDIATTIAQLFTKIVPLYLAAVAH
jgi:hypothetical protein